MPSVIKSQLVELVNPANSTATKLQFFDLPYLRFKQITGIEVLNVNDASKSPTNKDVVTNAQMIKSYLTLYLNDPSNPNNVGEWIQQVPLSLMHRVQNASTDPFVRQGYNLVGQTIYWEKCFLNFASSLGNTSDVSFLFNVYFKG
jgi:hypothetical protein